MISALVSGAAVTSVNSGLPFSCRNHKDRGRVLAHGGGISNVQKVVVNHELLLPGSIEPLVVLQIPCYLGIPPTSSYHFSGRSTHSLTSGMTGSLF